MSSNSGSEATEQGPVERGATSLRGATGATIGRRFWLVAASVSLLVFAAFVVVSFLSAANDNARIDRLQSHGIAVSVTVTNCIGNIGGSGSNVSGYTCRGDYSLGGTTYNEIIGSMSTLAVSGAKIRGVVDPSHHGTVELLAAVRRSSASSVRYVVPGLLSVVLIALVLALLRIVRRSDPSRHHQAAVPRSEAV
jgi:hypothetical protein